MGEPASLFSLHGRTALVTGASSGIGRDVALTLAKAGARMLLVARSAERLEEVRQEIASGGGHASSHAFDVSDAASVAMLAQEVSRLDAMPDILVNNAGTIDRSAFEQVEQTEWERVIAVNLTAPMLLAQAFAPSMRERRWGRIVNVASILALHGKPNAHSYVATKHAVAGLTKSMAAELGGEGICVNALCPGYIKTEINVALQTPEFDARITSRVPLRRWGTVEDLRGPMLMLCSEAASFVNGHLMVVDGGMTVTH